MDFEILSPNTKRLLDEILQSDNPTQFVYSKLENLSVEEADKFKFRLKELTQKKYISIKWADNKPYLVFICDSAKAYNDELLEHEEQTFSESNNGGKIVYNNSIYIGNGNKITKSDISIDSNKKSTKKPFKKKSFYERHPIICAFLISLVAGIVLMFSFWENIVDFIEGGILMAKSKIIKDLANGSTNICTSLKRAKILCTSLNDSEILNWINYEISGYPTEVVLPYYRIISGDLFGTFTRGLPSNYATFNNVSIPLGNMPNKIRDQLLKIEFRESINALKGTYESSKNGKDIAKNIPADLYSGIAKFNNDPFMKIASAYVLFLPEKIENVFSVVENKLLDILLLMEKEYGVLDELDLDISQTDNLKNQIIINEIKLIIYDNSITIGNDNKIKDSDITVTTDS